MIFAGMLVKEVLLMSSKDSGNVVDCWLSGSLRLAPNTENNEAKMNGFMRLRAKMIFQFR